jgi:probable HAF family extracellular repeat protein
MIDLGTLGGVLSIAYAINSNGQIVGYADTSTGETHAVLWNPVTVIPKPISAILFITGGAILVLRRFYAQKTFLNLSTGNNFTLSVKIQDYDVDRSLQYLTDCQCEVQ